MRTSIAIAVTLACLSGCASASLTRVVVRANVAFEAVEKESARKLRVDRDGGFYLDHNRDHVVVVSAEGRESRELSFKSTTSGLRITKTVLCSLFPLYTLIGLPYDIYGKRWHTLEPDEVTIELRPL